MLLRHLVIDCKGESFGQQSVISENFSMNSRVCFQTIDVTEDRIVEVAAKPPLLTVVESPASAQIVQGASKDANPHSYSERSRFLAVSQSTDSSLPAAYRSAVSANAAPCQSGDGRSGSCDKLSQRVSIIWSFSCTGSERISSVLIMSDRIPGDTGCATGFPIFGAVCARTAVSSLERGPTRAASALVGPLFTTY
jgi:hypothetical protein